MCANYVMSVIVTLDRRQRGIELDQHTLPAPCPATKASLRTFFSTFCEAPSVKRTGRNMPAHASTKLNTASDTGLQGVLTNGLRPMLRSASLIHQMLIDSCGDEDKTHMLLVHGV